MRIGEEHQPRWHRAPIRSLVRRALLVGGALGAGLVIATAAASDAQAGPLDDLLDPVSTTLDGVLAPVTDGVLEPVVDEVVTPLVDAAVAPVVEDVVTPVSEEILAPVVEETVAPVVTEVTEPVAPVIEEVVAPVAPVVEEVVAPVAPVIEAAVAPVAPVVDDIVAPVADAVVGPVLDEVAGVLAPVVDPLTPVLAPIAGLLTPVTEVVDGVLEPIAPVVDSLTPIPEDAVDSLAPVPGVEPIVPPAAVAPEDADSTSIATNNLLDSPATRPANPAELGVLPTAATGSVTAELSAQPRAATFVTTPRTPLPEPTSPSSPANGAAPPSSTIVQARTAHGADAAALAAGPVAQPACWWLVHDREARTTHPSTFHDIPLSPG